MDTVLCFLHIRGLIPQLLFYFRLEEKFAGGKFRQITCAVDIYFAGGTFRAKSIFVNMAKVSSTRKIRVIQYYVCLSQWRPWYCRTHDHSVNVVRTAVYGWNELGRTECYIHLVSSKCSEYDIHYTNQHIGQTVHYTSIV